MAMKKLKWTTRIRKPIPIQNYLNTTINIAPGFFIVPEVGYDHRRSRRCTVPSPKLSTLVPNGRSTSNLSALPA